MLQEFIITCFSSVRVCINRQLLILDCGCPKGWTTGDSQRYRGAPALVRLVFRAICIYITKKKQRALAELAGLSTSGPTHWPIQLSSEIKTGFVSLNFKVCSICCVRQPQSSECFAVVYCPVIPTEDKLLQPCKMRCTFLRAGCEDMDLI